MERSTEGSLKLKAQITEDYDNGILHLAWLRDDDKRTLLFCLVELLPKEQPTPTTEDQIRRRLGKKGQRYLHLQRFAVSAQEAIEWYIQCFKNNCFLPKEGGGFNNDKALTLYNLSDEPVWPGLVVVEEVARHLPFVPDIHVCPRVHHMLPTSMPLDILTLKEKPQAFEWLTKHLYFTFKQYPELLGSCHLVLPNPVLRGVSYSLIPASASWENEGILLKVSPRAGYNLKDEALRLTVEEHRSTGISTLIEKKLITPTDALYMSPDIDQIATKITCPKRGLLYWSKPTPFLRQISIDMGIITGIKTVETPSAGRRHPQSNYSVRTHSPASKRRIGNNVEKGKAKQIIRKATQSRQQESHAQQLDQKVFNKQPEEAKKFVRKLMNRANESLLIVDPYFTTRELFDYGLSLASSHIPIQILSSAEVLKGPDKGQTSDIAGTLLLQRLQNIQTQHQSNVNSIYVRVMKGRRPPIHDRFLIVDKQQVWSLGTSLCELGHRLSVVIKLPNPLPVVREVEQVWIQSPELHIWEAKRQGATT